MAILIWILIGSQMLNVSVNITFTETQPYKQFQVPASGKFVQVRHDWQTSRWSYKPRALTIGYSPNHNPEGAYPDTFPMDGCGPDEFTPLTEPVQRLWFECLRKASLYRIPVSELISRWAIITSDGRALTDDHAWNHVESNNTDTNRMFADYIQRLNLSNPKPMAQKCLTMGGNILKVYGETSTHYLVEAIDTVSSPSIESLWGKWWLIHWGTQSTIKPYGSGWKITDWSWLNYDNVPYGVPFLLFGDGGTNRIRKEYCKPISNGDTYTPYYP